MRAVLSAHQALTAGICCGLGLRNQEPEPNIERMLKSYTFRRHVSHKPPNDTILAPTFVGQALLSQFFDIFRVTWKRG